MTPGNKGNHSPRGAVGRSTPTRYPSTLPQPSEGGEKTVRPQWTPLGAAQDALWGDLGSRFPNCWEVGGEGSQLTLPRKCLWSEKLPAPPQDQPVSKTSPCGNTRPSPLASRRGSSQGQASRAAGLTWGVLSTRGPSLWTWPWLPCERHWAFQASFARCYFHGQDMWHFCNMTRLSCLFLGDACTAISEDSDDGARGPNVPIMVLKQRPWPHSAFRLMSGESAVTEG